MSLSGLSENSGSEKDLSDFELENSEAQKEGHHGGVAIARPPDSGLATSQSIAAANMIDFLDQLVEVDKISSERASRLKRKYNALLESIENSRTVENALLQESHQLQQELASAQTILEKADGFPESDSSETSRLRQAVLQQNNELMQCNERMLKYNREIEQLEEETRQLQREYEHMPKKEELQERYQIMLQEIQTLQDEIEQRSVDVKKTKEDIEKRTVVINSIQNDTNELLNLETTLQTELATISIAPANLPRELDKIKKSISENEQQIVEQSKMLIDLENERLQATVSINKLKDDAAIEQAYLMEERRLADKNQLTLDSVSKNLNVAKEHESSMLETGANTELQLKHRMNEYRTVYESLVAKVKEKDKDLKLLKKAELQLNSIESSYEQLKHVLEPLEIKLKEYKEMTQTKLGELKSLTNEVEMLRRAVQHQQSTELQGEQMLDYHLEKERELKVIVKRNLKIMDDLTKQIHLMMKQRDGRAKDYYKALYQKQQIEDDLRRVNNQIEDQQKRARDTETSLRDFAQAYEVVKTERNMTYSQIQISLRAASELKERLKVYETEDEMLHIAVDSKSKVLARSQLALVSKTQDRDVQYQELTKVRLLQEETNNELERQQETLYKLMQRINGMEKTLNRTRYYYEQGVQSRNDTGLKLIERNEEVCVFHEKINVQDSIAQQGLVKLEETEEEIRVLKMEIENLQRELQVCRKLLPEKESIEDELVTHQNMLALTKERLKDLEERVADARNPERVRLLPGKDPSCAELRDKLEKLQTQSINCEQNLLEKELLLEQVTRLLERVQKKANSRKETTLQIGTKVNSYQSKLRDTTHKMMAIISELSVQRALAMRLHYDLTDKETQLEQAYTRLEGGDAPDDDTNREWIKYLHRHSTKPLPINTNEEGRELPNGVYTTAEARPNAYIPDSDIELPLPKPYGSYAPFKPSTLGSNMRHIRKPQLPSIDI